MGEEIVEESGNDAGRGKVEPTMVKAAPPFPKILELIEFWALRRSA